MIVRERPGAMALLFIIRGSVVPRIAPHLLILLLFTLAVTALHGEHVANLAQYSIAPFTLLGIALSLFLGFRNNACYERWWEGRRQWGQMVSDIRSLARSASTLLAEREDRRRLLSLVAAHYHALRGQLRHKAHPAEVAEILARVNLAVPEVPGGNLSDRFLGMAGEFLGQCYRGGKLDTQGVRILDQHLSSLAGVQAACERLVSTPLPFAYTLLTHRTAYLYCYLLPFGLVGSMGWITPLFTVIVAYTFFGLDALAQELEAPFGDEPNHLPLDALCRVNDISIAESLGEPVPPVVTPVGHILS